MGPPLKQKGNVQIQFFLSLSHRVLTLENYNSKGHNGRVLWEATARPDEPLSRVTLVPSTDEVFTGPRL